jgi:glyoxylase-like metal-dependent hydrolase (beta-lactamase superfamily II)
MGNALLLPLRLGLVNAYLLVEGGRAVLVDGGYPGADIASALVSAGHSSPPPELAVVTHAHTDHFGGLKAYAASCPGLGIAVGAKDAAGLEQGINVDLAPFGAMGWLAGRFAGQPKPSGAGLAPTLLFQGGESLAQFGLDAEIIATPGHTRGSLSVFIPKAVDERGMDIGAAAIIGDLVMGGFLLKSRPRPPFFASGMDELRRSLATLKSRGTEILYPGHGGPLLAKRVFARFGV